mmetsp:Transcript_43707/g.36666  ORF Transcript_43707/g.36666 Transcript_43707/m.36666 type:complete len:97 (+) Transcript_43707:78-368(+)
MIKIKEIEGINSMNCPNCNMYINIVKQHNDTENKLKILMCTCGTMICINCKTREHKMKTCEENLSKVPKGEKLLDKFADKYKLKNCPNCQIYIERS